MSELGRLLECLHDAHQGARTVQAEFRDWQNPYESSRVIVDVRGPSPRLRWRDVRRWPRFTETRRRLWWEHPSRLRVELLQGGRLMRMGIRMEARWWRWDSQEGVSSGGPTGAGQVWIPRLLDPPLLSPVRLLGVIRLEQTGVGERAGRPVLLAEATSRELVRAGAPLSYQLEFDAEHGTMLRMAVYEHERCVRLTEALTICYDEPINSSRFQIMLPGEEELTQRVSINIGVGVGSRAPGVR